MLQSEGDLALFAVPDLGQLLLGDDTRKYSTHDLAPCGQVTLFTRITGEDWTTAHKVGDQLGVQISTVVIGLGRQMTDLHFDWAKLREVAEDGAVLVRHGRDPEQERIKMTLVFEHVTLGQRVLFGSGKAAGHLAAEVARLGASRVMVIATGSGRPIAEQVAAGIDPVLWWDDVVMHVPVEVAEKARAAAAGAGIDLLVCVGGGSPTGLAKAVALTSGIPIVAVPTTYAGSEATNVWGLTEAARKTTGVDDRVLPATVIYDAELTLSLPVELSVASGLNGLAHCVDSLWAPRADPINAALAAEGIRALAAGLPLIKENPAGLEGREQALYGAYLSAVAFASAGSGMHHKICHVLGGTFNLPHAQTHATVLPYVLAFNAPEAPEAAARIAAAFGTPDAVTGLNRLRETLEAPRALKDYGFTEENIPEAVDIILPVIPASNPRKVTTENLTRLLAAALTGEEPKTLTDR